MLHSVKGRANPRKHNRRRGTHYRRVIGDNQLSTNIRQRSHDIWQVACPIVNHCKFHIAHDVDIIHYAQRVAKMGWVCRTRLINLDRSGSCPSDGPNGSAPGSRPSNTRRAATTHAPSACRLYPPSKTNTTRPSHSSLAIAMSRWFNRAYPATESASGPIGSDQWLS